MIRIAAYQGICHQDLNQNLDVVYAVIKRAVQDGCDFLCFPEGYLSDYSPTLLVSLDDPQIRKLIESTGQHEMVVIVGISEQRGDQAYNTALIIHRGELLGKYRKTMLTGGDKQGFASDYDLPIFEAKGIPFGVIVCHDSSFVEPALVMRWKGARLLFSPHYNGIDRERMDEHRTLVRNNHVGLSTLLQMVVVRSNVVGADGDRLGYGDSTIFSPLGEVIVAAPLFKEALITAEFEESVFTQESWRTRREIPTEVYQQLWAAARQSIASRGDS